jgi:queuine tRNA-ribosyltransferase
MKCTHWRAPGKAEYGVAATFPLRRLPLPARGGGAYPLGMFGYECLGKDGKARRGRLTTAHGVVETPTFMPVGTAGSVKGITPDQLRSAGAEMILANTYHLMLRPGAETVARLGGVHRVMAWDGPILTDSGGYQVFSLAHLRRIDEEGVTFQSHIDGSQQVLTPRRAVEIQRLLGADVIMQLDECPPAEAAHEHVAEAVRRSGLWARACREAWLAARPSGTSRGAPGFAGLRRAKSPAAKRGEGKMGTGTESGDSMPIRSQSPFSAEEACSVQGHFQALFGIQQGGVYPDLRARSAAGLVELDLPGYAIGGLSVGEGHQAMCDVLDRIDEQFPADRPRYLMGVGEPRDLLAAVMRGVDMFDCVLPTRNGRNAQAFTWGGRVRLRNAQWAADTSPLDERCGCFTCRNYSRGVLRHLFAAKEMLGPTLVTIHNLRFFASLMSAVREAIAAGELAASARRWMAGIYGEQ